MEAAKQLTRQELPGLQFVIAQNQKVRDVIMAVVERQRGSVAMNRRALGSLSGLPSQLAYESPLLPLCVERASGARIIDVDGNEYIDCHMAYTASILGHNPAIVQKAVQAAMERGLAGGHFFKEQVELGELVLSMVPGLERVAFFHTGGEAINASVRLAKTVTGKTRVAKFEGCYHGSNEIGLQNTWMILAGQIPSDPIDGIRPIAATGGFKNAENQDFLILPYNSPVALDLIRRHAADLACVVVDPLPPFMAPFSEEAKRFTSEVCGAAGEAGVPVIFDEVVCGFRVAKGGAREWTGQAPSMSCYGKVTSGLGIPLSMVGGAGRFLDAGRTNGLFRDYFPKKAWLASTLSSSFIPVIAALAQLRYLSSNYDEIVGRLDRSHTALAEQLTDVARDTGIPVALRGHPRMGFHLAFGDTEPEEKTYRTVMASSSPAQFRALMAMTFYLRLNGIYAKVIPTMNLSAAHTEEDIERLADGIRRSVIQMKQDGLLDF